jgi:hypothetical protein
MRSRAFAACLQALSLLTATQAASAEPVYAWDRVDRVVAFADVHGAYPELVALLQEAGVLDRQLRWGAGAAHLVSLGDLLDRGSDSRAVMDLLMRLEKEAAAAGGRVHAVLGNHELMNLTGELDYVSAAEFASYQDLETDEMRRTALKQLQTSGRFGGGAAQAQRDFDARFPKGWFGHRRAFAPDGIYGRWLLERPVLIRIGEVLFAHGGLPPLLADTTLAAVNESLRADAVTYTHAVQQLLRAGLIDADSPFDERVQLARQRLAQRSASSERDELAQLIEVLERSGSSPVHDPRGPLWYRGTALCNALYETDTAQAALDALDAKQVVIGHSVSPTLTVVTRLGGRATMLDTGMLKSVYRGRAAALVFDSGIPKVIYAESHARQGRAPAPAPRLVGARPSDMDDAALEGFLQRAEIVESAPLDPQEPRGATLVTLRDGDVKIRAVFHAGRASGWQRELAAYQLDKAIGLDMVPATVAREYRGQRGALQFHIENAESLETLQARQAKFGGWCPLGPQYTLVSAFDALIGNPARSAADVWIAPDEWLVRLTGHSRGFTASRTLAERARELALPAELRRRLATLRRERLASELRSLLTTREIDAVLARRDELLRSTPDS